ncbi:hypothetical protein J2T25_002585 [Citrobacter amalonaticus]|uniref:hypothetical protein n=1 Tax=Citrobacter amalonaticus TaxID=35703 RepID=UPI00209D6989|nr:hypothetical protein [Citrobacter amalonaticus]MCP1629634.1 hypothetical protein [Citrobacter amalonaticus]
MTSTVQSAALQIQLGDIPGPVLALTGVILGAFLTFFFQQITLNRQRKHDRQKEMDKLLREKGEELHQLLSQWGKSTLLYQLNQLNVVKGILTEQQFNEIAKDITLEKGSHDRLETLLFLYFSELEPFMVKVRRSIENGNSAYDLALRGVKNIKEASKLLCLASDEVNVELDKIKSGIRRIIQSLN